MSGLSSDLGLILIGAELMLTLLGLGGAIIMPGIDRWSKWFFTSFFGILLIYVSLCVAEDLWIHPGMRRELAIIYYFDTLFVSFLPPLMTFYLVHCCGEDWHHSTLLRVVTVLWSGSFIVLNMSLFTNWVYYVTSERELFRGPLYSVLVAFYLTIMVLNMFRVFSQKEKLSRGYYFTFVVGMLPITVSLFILFFVFDFTLFGIGLAICALSMYGIILWNQVRQYMRLQRDIAHQRAGVMVLQMRPHFIYNTMMSIYYLCKQDPDLAQQVTLDFTTYLRKNFTAIASEDPIPFSEELTHTRAYLAVEQAQFEDSLFVDYDTPYIDFRVPPLTLQPIVENAVKHGMDQDSEPLHIFIRTRRTDSGNEIVVENNGADFKPADKEEPHIALENIRQRLEVMCNGNMMILPREGGGTVVKVMIPE